MGCTICYALGGEWPPWHCPPSADCCENAIFQFIVMGDPVQSYACREARDFSYKWQPLGRPQISEHSGIHHPLACHPHHRQAPPSASRCEVGDAHPALTYPNTPRHGTFEKYHYEPFPGSPPSLHTAKQYLLMSQNSQGSFKALMPSVAMGRAAWSLLPSHHLHTLFLGGRRNSCLGTGAAMPGLHWPL